MEGTFPKHNQPLKPHRDGIRKAHIGATPSNLAPSALSCAVFTSPARLGRSEEGKGDPNWPSPCRTFSSQQAAALPTSAGEALLLGEQVPSPPNMEQHIEAPDEGCSGEVQETPCPPGHSHTGNGGDTLQHCVVPGSGLLKCPGPRTF